MIGKPECLQVREAIGEEADYLDNVDCHLDIDEPGYDEQTDELSRSMDRMRIAFRGRPAVWAMQLIPLEAYECDECDFRIAL
jgi:hypothetical protein